MESSPLMSNKGNQQANGSRNFSRAVYVAVAFSAFALGAFTQHGLYGSSGNGLRGDSDMDFVAVGTTPAATPANAPHSGGHHHPHLKKIDKAEEDKVKKEVEPVLKAEEGGKKDTHDNAELVKSTNQLIHDFRTLEKERKEAIHEANKIEPLMKKIEEGK